MDTLLKIEKVEPFEFPKGVKFKTLLGMGRFKKQTREIDDDKDFEETLFIDEVLDQDE